MKTKRLLSIILILITFSISIFPQTKQKNKKESFVEITLDELNNSDIESIANKTRKGILIKDYYTGGIENNSIKVDYSNIENDYPALYERLYHHSWEKEIATCTIKGKTKYEVAFGGTLTITVTEIENLRSEEELNEIKNLMNERLEKIKNKIREIKKDYDQKGRTLSKGYVYHGLEESEHNTKLFVNGALEKGHAYYISNLKIKDSLNSFVSVPYGFDRKTVLVTFDSQTLKGNIIDAEETDVIVIGGSIPKVIGITGSQFVKYRAKRFNLYEVDVAEPFDIIEQWTLENGDFISIDDIEYIEETLKLN